MSISSSTEILSSENEHNLEEKNIPSPNLPFAKECPTLLPEKADETKEKPKIYQKKNGSLKFKIKCENESLDCLRPQPMRYVPISPDFSLKLNDQLNSQNLLEESNYLKANQLEFEAQNCRVSQPKSAFQPFTESQNSFFGSYFQERSTIPNEIFLSKIFSKNLETINKFYLPQSYPNLFLIPKEIFLPKDKPTQSPKEKEPKRIKPQEKIQTYELVKLSLEVPEDFLVQFQITEIEVKTNPFNQYNHQNQKLKKISFKDMETFINYLCKKVVTKDIFKGNLDYGEEYIEYERSKNEENLDNFLQRKRKLSKDKSEIAPKTKFKNGSNGLLGRRHPLKKKYKKINKKLTVKLKNLIKLNNKKNGPSININLNQIQINKTGLENFPFHPLLNSKEITKISFLKGLAERKDLIRINKKVGLIKEIKSHKYLDDKLYKITYQNLNDDTKYIVNIIGINILHLILYYYYQIHKRIEQINTYHYSHSAFSKSMFEINIIEEIIRKSNLIVKEIIKEI